MSSDLVIVVCAPDAADMFDADFNPIQTTPLGTRHAVEAALSGAVPEIDFSYGADEEAYIDVGVYVRITGDPVTEITLSDADQDVLDLLGPLLNREGWSVFDAATGSRVIA